MKRLLITLLAALPLFAAAQGNDPRAEFEAFRQQAKGDYNAFKKSVLDDYATFLDGVWQEYKAMQGVARNSQPKPKTMPVAEEPSVPVAEEPKPEVPAVDAPVAEAPKPEIPTIDAPIAEEPKPEVPAIDVPELPAIDIPEPDAPLAEQPSVGEEIGGGFSFSFFGTPQRAVELKTDLAGATTENFGTYWKRIDSDPDVKAVTRDLKAMAAQWRLNDWLTLELARAYAEGVADRWGDAAAVLLFQYLASHLGYDVRLARSGKEPVTMIAMKKMVYWRSYVTDGDKMLFIFPKDFAARDFTDIAFCSLPDGEALGRSVDLVIDRSLNFNGKKKAFTITSNGMTLEGEVDASVMEMVRRYPQMPIADYARSCLDSNLRMSLIEQVRSQLGTLPRTDAVGKLLSFAQHGFDYATDGDYHGYEKPYFLEEIFYYPKCDCEDRSVFFAYLAKAALSTDNVLVSYPGHECVAVKANDGEFSGDGFTYDGMRFCISDPTYVGAAVGRCMPEYKTTAPDIETWY